MSRPRSRRGMACVARVSKKGQAVVWGRRRTVSDARLCRVFARPQSRRTSGGGRVLPVDAAVMISSGPKTTQWRDDLAGGADPFCERSIAGGSIMDVLL